MYAPLFPTIAFGIHLQHSADIDTAITAVTTSGRLQCAEFDSLVPVHPQVMPGHLSVLSYPSIIAQGARPHCAVLLDVTRVGGACQALTLPIDIGLREFLERISMLINVDVEAEQVNVWVGPTTQPASYGGQLSITHGTLITVTQSHVRAPAIFYAEGLFGLGRDWTRLDHVPKPARAHCMAVCHSRGIHPVVLAFFPRYFKEDIALQVTKSSREEATVIIVDNLPVLDLDGEPCPQTAVVLPKKPEQCQNETQAQSTAPTVAYLLDVRPLGIAPKLVLSEGALPDLPDILGQAGIELPSGYCGHLIRNTIVGHLQDLYWC